MYRLTIGVGCSIFKAIATPFSNTGDLFDRINQCTIILSDSIIAYYQDNLGDYSEAFNKYLESILNVDNTYHYYEEDQGVDAIDDILNYVSKDPMKTLISFQEEFYGRDLSKVFLVTPESIRKHDGNPFYWYTFPITNHSANIGDACGPYAVWLGNLFKNEKRIRILDQYILANNGIQSLKKYYLPRIEYGAEIDIYCELDKCDGKTVADILSIVQTDFSNWNVHVHLCKHMHDRWIELSELQISLGHGIIFLDSYGKLSTACTINATTDRVVPIPPIVSTIC